MWPQPRSSSSSSSTFPSSGPSSPSSLSSPSHPQQRWLRWCLVVCGGLLCVGLVGWLLPRFLRPLLSWLLSLDGKSPSSALLFFAVVALMCSPVTLGYGLVFTTGVVFGWYGFPIVYIARSPHSHYSVNRCFDCCPSYSLYLRAFTSALESRPVQTTALLQFSFLPFGALGALLSTTELSLTSFFLACTLSRVKLLSYIWLAQSATTLQNLWTSERQWGWRDVTTLCLSISLSITALTVVTVLANRQLRRIQLEEEEVEEVATTRREGGSGGEDREEGGAGGVSSQGRAGKEGERGNAKMEGRDRNIEHPHHVVDVEGMTAYDRLLSPSTQPTITKYHDRDTTTALASSSSSSSSSYPPSSSSSSKWLDQSGMGWQSQLRDGEEGDEEDDREEDLALSSEGVAGVGMGMGMGKVLIGSSAQKSSAPLLLLTEPPRSRKNSSSSTSTSTVTTAGTSSSTPSSSSSPFSLSSPSAVPSVPLFSSPKDFFSQFPSFISESLTGGPSLPPSSPSSSSSFSPLPRRSSSPSSARLSSGGRPPRRRPSDTANGPSPSPSSSSSSSSSSSLPLPYLHLFHPPAHLLPHSPTRKISPANSRGRARALVQPLGKGNKEEEEEEGMEEVKEEQKEGRKGATAQLQFIHHSVALKFSVL